MGSLESTLTGMSFAPLGRALRTHSKFKHGTAQLRRTWPRYTWPYMRTSTATEAIRKCGHYRNHMNRSLCCWSCSASHGGASYWGKLSKHGKLVGPQWRQSNTSRLSKTQFCLSLHQKHGWGRRLMRPWSRTFSLPSLKTIWCLRKGKWRPVNTIIGGDRELSKQCHSKCLLQS